jgi:hypothetical protein
MKSGYSSLSHLCIPGSVFFVVSANRKNLKKLGNENLSKKFHNLSLEEVIIRE